MKKYRVGVVGIGKGTNSIGFGLVCHLLDRYYARHAVPNEFYLYNRKPQKNAWKQEAILNHLSELVYINQDIQDKIIEEYEKLTNGEKDKIIISRENIEKKIKNKFNVEENNSNWLLDYGVLKFVGCKEVKPVVENSDVLVVAFDANNDWKQRINSAPENKKNAIRENLLNANLEGIDELASVIRDCKSKNPDFHTVVVTNPVCELTHALRRFSDLEGNRLTGYAVIDSNRLTKALIRELKNVEKGPYSLENVYIVGRHDSDTKKERRSMALYSAIKINGTPFENFLDLTSSKKQIKETADQQVGVEVEAHSNTTLTITPTLAQVVESILLEDEKIFPMATLLHDENLFVVWPIKYINKRAYPVANFSTKEIAEKFTKELARKVMSSDESELFDKIIKGLRKKINFLERYNFQPRNAVFRQMGLAAASLACVVGIYFGTARFYGPAKSFLEEQGRKWDYKKYSSMPAELNTLANSGELALAEKRCEDNTPKLKNKIKTNESLAPLLGSINDVCSNIEGILKENDKLIDYYSESIKRVASLSVSKEFGDAKGLCERIQPEIKDRIKYDDRLEKVLKQAAVQCRNADEGLKKKTAYDEKEKLESEKRLAAENEKKQSLAKKELTKKSLLKENVNKENLWTKLSRWLTPPEPNWTFSKQNKDSGVVASSETKADEKWRKNQLSKYMKAYDEIEKIMEVGYKNVDENELLKADIYSNWLLSEKIDYKIFPEMREKVREVKNKDYGAKAELRDRIYKYYDEGKKSVVYSNGAMTWEPNPFNAANQLCILLEKNSNDKEFPELIAQVKSKHKEVREFIISSEFSKINEEKIAPLWRFDASDPNQRFQLAQMVNQVFFKDNLTDRIKLYEDPILTSRIEELINNQKNRWLDYLSKSP